MEHSLPIAEPVAFARPRGAHRFEAFSPKLGRRMTFYRRAELDQWVLLEADPAVMTFCERPGYVEIDGDQRLADFWVRYADRDKLVILDDSERVESESTPLRKLDADVTPLLRIATVEMAAARIWIDNWQRMLPYLVANRDLVPLTLSQAIVRFVKEPQRLLSIEREFSTMDPVLIRTAVFGLLHSGQAAAPELHTQPLSLITSFVAVGTAS
ncbi:hypothetical protein [Paraburkholderia tagetis]|uniref:TnsA endonuclease N terminal n=1 Tax=Paraburkholderia tagetis TaxID=2913261 RepID=A0A9X1RXM9_9BURK|nr:hypothetical protein [Paraburkholderia tagetis]MCG5076623.1 hypothetical protein [Paraburkholderia tagetis]